MPTHVTETDLLEAKPEEVGMSSDRLARLTGLIERYIDSGRLPGAVTMVARRDRLVHVETYGNMDDEAAKRMRPDAIVRAYSMSKPIASLALMQLYEHALFQLDDPVSAYIPEFANLKVFDGGDPHDFRVREPAREMTIRDLLTHTSGLVDHDEPVPVGEMYAAAQLPEITSTGTLSDMIRMASALPLHCDPGTEWKYGISSDVVGHLVEVVSGQRFDRYLDEHLFQPLEMNDTGFHVPESEVDRLAACYERSDSAGSASDGAKRYRLVDAPANSRYTQPTSYPSGAMGIVTSAPDYMKFSRMLANKGALNGERVIGPRTLSLMTANHLPDNRDLAGMGQDYLGDAPQTGIGFGLGFGVLLDPVKAHVLGSPGEFYWGGAASTAFFVSPDDELAVVLVTQVMPSSSYPIRRELRAAVYQAIES